MPYRRGNVDPMAKTGRVGTLAEGGIDNRVFKSLVAAVLSRQQDRSLKAANTCVQAGNVPRCPPDAPAMG